MAVTTADHASPSPRLAALTVQGFKAIEQPAQFLLAILAARALPASQYGLATILISIQALYVAVATFGFDEISATPPRGGEQVETRRSFMLRSARGPSPPRPRSSSASSRGA